VIGVTGGDRDAEAVTGLATKQQTTGDREMRETHFQSDKRRPLSAYILIAAVIVLDLWLVYLVNVELLPLVFDLDRELYRQVLLDVVIRTATTALGVFGGLLLFHALGWSPQKPGRDELQEDAPTRGIEQGERE
jgi:hypothetical protein